jgi:hypothetical protein
VLPGGACGRGEARGQDGWAGEWLRWPRGGDACQWVKKEVASGGQVAPSGGMACGGQQSGDGH